MAMEPRTYEELAQHAEAVQAELAIAQGTGYIAGPDSHLVNLPGFKGLSIGSGNLGSNGEAIHWVTFNVACNHIRFLEHAVERLAAQVAELAERLAFHEDRQ